MLELDEFLAEVEFTYTYDKDKNTIKLVDLLGVNLGNIESEEYPLNKYTASFITDRLSNYFYDYVVSGIEETLKEECNYNDTIYPYDEKLLPAMKEHSKVFGKGLIELIEDYCADNIYIKELDNK